MTAGLLIFLTMLVVMGKFLDFLFGEKGDQEVKARLDRIAEDRPAAAANFGSFPCRAAAAVETFLDAYFGPILSWRAVLHCLYFSGTVTSLITLVVILTDTALPSFFETAAGEGGRGLTIAFFLVLLANFQVDCISLTVTRLLLRATQNATARSVWYLVVLQLVLSYFFVVMAMNLTFSGIIFSEGIVEGYFANTLGRGDFLGFLNEALAAWRVLFESYTLQSYLAPVATGEQLAIGSTNLLVFSMTAALPSLLYAVTMATAAVLQNLEFLIGPLRRRLLDRLAEHERPVFLNIALGTAVLIPLVKLMV